MSTSLADQPQPETRPRRGVRTFAWLVVAMLLATAVYVVLARPGAPGSEPGAGPLPAGPMVMVQNLAAGDGFGQVAVVPMAELSGPRALTGLRCDRVHYAAGHGLCLAIGSGFPPIEYAMTFGADLRVTHQIALNGLPSRTRVSSDGRFGAATVFVTGHSYLESGFSTSTILVDMAAGTALANLEDFTVLRDGAPFKPADTNIWGVTFAPDSNRFVATLATGGKTYLVDGDIARRTLVVGRENVECPSLSPDGTRIGFKKRLDNGSGVPVWRFHVLDVATGKETPLAEARSVDDQLEWLDDNIVVYGSPDSGQAVFAVPADGTGQPRQLLGEALSPAVVRAPLTTAAVGGPALPTAKVSVAVNGPPAATAGGAITQTITVTNTGSVDATRLVVDDTLTGPAKAASATATTPPGASGFGCTVLVEENRARCDVSRLAAGATWQVTITLTTNGPGAVVGNVIASAAELTPDSGQTTATTTTAVA